jgi:hypothetical protein
VISSNICILGDNGMYVYTYCGNGWGVKGAMTRWQLAREGDSGWEGRGRASARDC